MRGPSQARSAKRPDCPGRAVLGLPLPPQLEVTMTRSRRPVAALVLVFVCLGTVVGAVDADKAL